MTTGACSPLDPCTVITRTSFAPLSPSRLMTFSPFSNQCQKALQVPHPVAVETARAMLSISSIGTSASVPKRATNFRRAAIESGQNIFQKVIDGHIIGRVQASHEAVPISEAIDELAGANAATG